MQQNQHRPGYKQTKVGWIPEEWRANRIERFCNLRSGGTPARNNHAYWGGAIPWATTSEVKYGVIMSARESITNAGLLNSSACLLKKGTLVAAMYGQGATRGRVALLGRDMAVNQACLAIMPDTNIACVTYLYQRLIFDYHRLRSYSQGGNQENLSSDLIGMIHIPLPPLPEQKKIAAILSTWDDAIDKIRALIATKKQRKKALMQQLLTGKRRLRGFGGEWVERPIGSLYKTVSRHLEWDDGTTFSLLSVRRRSGGVFLRERLRGSKIKTKTMFTAHAGDFLISKMQVLHGATGLVPKDLDGCHISGSYIALRPNGSGEIDPAFFARISSTSKFYHLTFLSSYGVHIEKMTFNLDWFLKSKITIPTNIKEQRAIAAVLDTVDREIAVLEAKLAALEQQKKGLMQRLLTGHVRVKTQNDTC